MSRLLFQPKERSLPVRTSQPGSTPGTNDCCETRWDIKIQPSSERLGLVGRREWCHQVRRPITRLGSTLTRRRQKPKVVFSPKPQRHQHSKCWAGFILSPDVVCDASLHINNWPYRGRSSGTVWGDHAAVCRHADDLTTGSCCGLLINTVSRRRRSSDAQLMEEVWWFTSCSLIIETSVTSDEPLVRLTD